VVSFYEGVGEGEEDGGRDEAEDEEVGEWLRGILKRRLRS
jgi:hypothetical protein